MKVKEKEGFCVVPCCDEVKESEKSRIEVSFLT
jgi:hypothetical protein